MYFSETDRKRCSGRIEIADGDKRNQFEVSNLNSSNKALLSFSNPSPERVTSWLRHQIRQSVSMVFLGGELQPSLRWNVSAIAVETDMNFLQINEPPVVVNQKEWKMYSFKRFWSCMAMLYHSERLRICLGGWFRAPNGLLVLLAQITR